VLCMVSCSHNRNSGQGCRCAIDPFLAHAHQSKYAPPKSPKVASFRAARRARCTRSMERGNQTGTLLVGFLTFAQLCQACWWEWGGRWIKDHIPMYVHNRHSLLQLCARHLLRWKTKRHDAHICRHRDKGRSAMVATIAEIVPGIISFFSRKTICNSKKGSFAECAHARFASALSPLACCDAPT